MHNKSRDGCTQTFTDKWMDKENDEYTHNEYYAALKKKKILLCATT